MPKSNPRLEEIRKKNAEWEKATPYNYCDRWCERCPHETQMRCRLYLDDLERRATCLAHGKEEDDPEITEAVLEAQHADLGRKLGETAQRLDIDLDQPDLEEPHEDQAIEFEDLPQEIQRHITFVQNHPLPVTVDEYRKRAHQFLKNTFYEKKEVPAALKYDFETIAWYHTLLPAKIQRALAGFHEPVCEDEYALYDAIVQFDICQKAVKKSAEAIRQLKTHYPKHAMLLTEMLALLSNILSRIEAMEESI